MSAPFEPDSAPVGAARRPRSPRLCVVALALAGGLAATACASSDDGATVRDLGSDGSEGSSSGASSGSASAVAGDDVEASASSDGGYDYVSNVDGQRLITQDVCEIKETIESGEESGDIDYDAVDTIYRDGEYSERSDGTKRTLADQAESAGIDPWMTEAIDGTGRFADRTADERAEAIEKGAQNQTLVSWVKKELVEALEKVDAGNIDPDSGAPHNWDEAWAFYHGAQPACAPYATADSRAANFGTLAEGDTAEANVVILQAMIAGRDAVVDGDAEAVVQAAAEVEKQIVVTYSQAMIRYATLVQEDEAAGDTESAGVHRVEGLAFYLVIRDDLEHSGADVAALDAAFDLDADDPPGGDRIRELLDPAWTTLGITEDEIGTLG